MSFGFKRLDNFKPIKIDDKLVEEVKENADTHQEIDENAIEKQVEVTEDKVEDIKEEIETTDDMVICLDTGDIYKDNKEASEKTGINAGSIKRVCNGTAKSAGKMKWMYYKDYLNK